MSAYTFHETKNSLHKDILYKTLKVESEYYKALIAYSGDYATDFENKTIDSKKLELSCTPIPKQGRQSGYPFVISPRRIFLVNCPTGSLCTEKQIKDLMASLEITQASMDELTKVLDEYFPNDNLEA